MWIGNQLQVFNALPGWAMVIVLSFVVSLLTNVTSNTAMCTLLMPIMAIMVGKLEIMLCFAVLVILYLFRHLSHFYKFVNFYYFSRLRVLAKTLFI